ncbi:BnaCnng29030D [Brassica napus]|uniref:Post-GPI attachment to proteins factor 3 n=1 Tax=Brassica napus TaxID=3708 RepID=A0A078IYL1_BRANA|nr:BnaCnng29030D [Brassica napus]
MVNSWEALYSGNYMKSKKANKKFEFKVFTETGLITDGTQQNDSDLKNKGGKPTVRVSNVGHALHVWLNGEYHAMMRRAHGHCQDPASVTFSVLSLAMHFHGWLSFIITLYYKDVDITKRLDYSSAIAVLGFSLIVSILRTFDVRVEAARVMVSAPLLALVTTHVLYINFYKLDYGWNMIVCVAMGVAQLFLWARWAVSRHPSNWKLWVVVIASGYFDVHSIWHLATVPLTILWWSFIRDDDEFRTSSLLKKSKTKAK